MSLFRDAFRGALAGAAATWAMDQVTTVMLAVQAPEVTKQEEAGQANGKSSVTPADTTPGTPRTASSAREMNRWASAESG